MVFRKKKSLEPKSLKKAQLCLCSKKGFWSCEFKMGKKKQRSLVYLHTYVSAIGAVHILMHSQLIIEIYAIHLARGSWYPLLIVKLTNCNQAQTLGHIPLCLWKPLNRASSRNPAAFVLCLARISELLRCYVWGIHYITKVIDNFQSISSLPTLLTQIWTWTSVTV